jgi:mRNA-degrading endonuclease toxin of MazEF toxin-antitoxin module
MVQRPAVILTPKPIGRAGLLLWTAMITNAERQHWPGDLTIPDAEELGLVIPSKVRSTKIAAVEAKTAVRIGRLPDLIWAQLRALIQSHLDG